MLIAQVRRSVFWGGVALAGGFAAFYAFFGLVVAGAVVLAGEVGWVAALAIASGAVLLLGLLIALFARWRAARSTRTRAMPRETRLRAQHARHLIKGDETVNQHQHRQPHHHEAAPPHAAMHESHNDQHEASIQDKVAVFAMKNPAAAAGGALAVLALFGPTRTIKLLGRGMMLAGIASSIVKHQKQRDVHGGHVAPPDLAPTTSPPRASTNVHAEPTVAPRREPAVKL